MFKDNDIICVLMKNGSTIIGKSDGEWDEKGLGLKSPRVIQFGKNPNTQEMQVTMPEFVGRPEYILLKNEDFMVPYTITDRTIGDLYIKVTTGLSIVKDSSFINKLN